MAKFYGLITVRQKQLAWPLFGKDREAIARIAEENPVEMLERLNIRPGELDMFIAYAGRDEFNIEAQVESFLYAARPRGLTIEVAYDPNGHHTPSTAGRLFSRLCDMVGAVIARI